LSAYLAQNARAAWALIAGVALVFALGVFWLDVEIRTQQRQALLQTEAQRNALELLSTTLNGNLMGSLTLLGLLDGDIKQEASNGLIAEDANVSATMSIVGNGFGAEGVFVVGMDGIVKSSWDRINKPSTGLDVRFRPYFQMAMRGQSSVYAAVSLARGERALYFTAPVFSEHARSTVGMGAVVARTTLDRVDSLLQGKHDVALLLSPQGVVFAGSRNDWIGRLAGAATPERLQAIRELKQFGGMFEKQMPLALPLDPVKGIQTFDGNSYAVALAPVSWNDPAGDWSLVVAEDLGRTVPVATSAARAMGGALLLLLLGWMWLRLMRVRHAQELASAQLQIFAKEQERQVQYREQLGVLSMRLQHCTDWPDFATTFFQSARDMAGVVQGCLYVAQGEMADQVLLLAGYAACAEAPQPSLNLGEGLLGQCALERNPLLIQTPPAGIWNLRSGLGGAPMAALMLAPLVIQDVLIGVVEMGLLVVPDAQHQQQLDELVALLANHLEIHRGNFALLEPPPLEEFVEVQE
jgi:two-component system C4-dicarboxylate transport sensor histidine kinase DctB